jgi:hypothetical protein
MPAQPGPALAEALRGRPPPSAGGAARRFAKETEAAVAPLLHDALREVPRLARRRARRP